MYKIKTEKGFAYLRLDTIEIIWTNENEPNRLCIKCRFSDEYYNFYTVDNALKIAENIYKLIGTVHLDNTIKSLD